MPFSSFFLISPFFLLQPLELQKLVKIWQKMSTTHPIPTRSHKYKLKVYQETFLGEDLIQWLFENEGMFYLAYNTGSPHLVRSPIKYVFSHILFEDFIVRAGLL